jgi:hypothetical protein
MHKIIIIIIIIITLDIRALAVILRAAVRASAEYIVTVVCR